MSDLLKKKTQEKKSNLLQRSSTPSPVTTYNRNDIYSLGKDKSNDIPTKKTKSKTTTIRCTQDTANLINALL